MGDKAGSHECGLQVGGTDSNDSTGLPLGSAATSTALSVCACGSAALVLVMLSSHGTTNGGDDAVAGGWCLSSPPGLMLVSIGCADRCFIDRLLNTLPTICLRLRCSG